MRIEQKEAEKRAEEFRKTWVKGSKCCLNNSAYKSAIDALSAKAQSFYDAAYDAIEKIQQEYDDRTDHGADHEKQDEYNKEYE